MPSVTTVGKWIHLPTAGGADDRFRPDQPLGAGLMQVAASNAALGARENGARCLWEHPGAIDVLGGLDFGTDPAAAFPWDAYPSALTPLVLFAGVHRVRTWGETGRWPRVVLSCDLYSDGSSTAGVILVGRPTMGRPRPGELNAYATTTSATPSSVDLVLTLSDYTSASVVVAPVTGATTPVLPPVESGRHTEMAFYVGIWNGAAGKSNVGGLTLYLKEPA